MGKTCPGLALLLLLVCCCSSNDSSPRLGSSSDSKDCCAPQVACCDATASVESHTTPFFELLRVTHVGQEEHLPDLLWDRSPVVVRGCITEATDGRTIDFAAGASNPLHTLVFKVDVLEVIRDDLEQTTVGSVYVEFVRGGVEVDSYQQLLSDAPQMVLFLREADTWDRDVYKFDNEGAGHPTGSTLLTFTAPEGLVVMTEGGLEYPWYDFPQSQVFDTASRSLCEFGMELSVRYDDASLD